MRQGGKRLLDVPGAAVGRFWGCLNRSSHRRVNYSPHLKPAGGEMNQPLGTTAAENPRATPQQFQDHSQSYLGKASLFPYPRVFREGQCQALQE